MRSIGVFIVRLTVGSLVAGHGAQKLFGSFGGSGLEGTAEWLESVRLRPGSVWAPVAAGSELAAGVLTAVGLFNPLGPIAGIAVMTMAWAKVHFGRPVWATSGGAELPLTNAAVLAGVAIAGPGAISADRVFGIRVPRRVVAVALAATAAGVWAGARRELVSVAGDLSWNGSHGVRGEPLPSGAATAAGGEEPSVPEGLVEAAHVAG